MADVALAAATAAVALVAAGSTGARWLVRRRPHDLAWAIALGLLALAAAALAWGARAGWSPASFKAFYWAGAIANLPVLALATVALHGGGRRARPAAWLVAAVLAASVPVVALAEPTAAIPVEGVPSGSRVLPLLPRAFAGGFAGAAALVVLGAALWSAWRIRSGPLVTADGLVAFGALATGGSGLLSGVADEVAASALSLLVGVALIVAGARVAAAVGDQGPDGVRSGDRPRSGAASA